MITSLHEVVDCFDAEGRVDGFQFGREASIDAWKDAKEEEAFRTMCRRLYQREWARRNRERNRDQLRQYVRERRAKKAKEICARQQEWRRKKYYESPVVNQCRQCGKCWVPPYEQRPKKSQFCCKKCRNAWHGPRRKRRSRGIRQMTLRADILSTLRAKPLASFAEIVAAVNGKRDSVRGTLFTMCKERLLLRHGGLVRGTFEINPESIE